ncbi:uncharacterized protein LOC125869789 [Solanum stenotomum]|uniref:uncharacterized protein LOC125869789 n=1 Tax=Solanum stenotomum TaxID=172797 RepID=UPI0020D11D3F|nr:uncharacterized protein LOC125869789 [Solanum stenotomum]
MSHFVTGVPDAIEKECQASMLHENIDIFRLMVHAQQVEESRLRKRNREVKRPRADEANASKGKFEGQCEPRFKKRFPNQSPLNAPRPNKGWVSTPRPQGGKGGGPYVEKTSCENCDKKLQGKCLVQGRENKQAQASGSNSDAPKKNHFYDLQSRCDQETSLDVVTGSAK